MGGEYRAYSFILKGFVTTCICGSSLTFPSKITKLPQFITVLQTACFLFPIRASVRRPEIETFQCFWASLVIRVTFAKIQNYYSQEENVILLIFRFFLQNFSPRSCECVGVVLNSWFPHLWFLSSIHNFHYVKKRKNVSIQMNSCF